MSIRGFFYHLRRNLSMTFNLVANFSDYCAIMMHTNHKIHILRYSNWLNWIEGTRFTALHSIVDYNRDFSKNYQTRLNFHQSLRRLL
jgi:hypothetical protein